MPRPKVVKLKYIEDLIHVLNVSQLPVIHHLSVDSRHVYFITVGMPGDVGIIYYVTREKPLLGKFILYNSFTGEIKTSSVWTSDSRYMVVPVVEVEKHNLFTEKIFIEGDKEKNSTAKETARRGKDENGGKLATVLHRVKK